MGDCRYCHSKAGFFKNSHEACAKRAVDAETALRTLIVAGVNSDVAGKELSERAAKVIQSGKLQYSGARSLMLGALDGAVQTLAIDCPVSETETDRILGIYEAIDPEWDTGTAEQHAAWPGFLTLLHSSTLYDVLHGNVPHSRPEMASGFRLRSDESPIVRRITTLAQYKSISSGSTFQSVSIPIGAGLYYRVGSSRANRTQTNLTRVDEGLMLLTTQAIYFSGDLTTFRIDYDSIIRIEPFADGFEVHEGHGSGKVFITSRIGTIDEGWYFYNIVAALSDRAGG